MKKKVVAAPRRPHSISFDDAPTMTQQEFKDECDVNQIVDAYVRTGILPRVNPQQARYGYAPALDFREALELVRQQDSLFSELPAEVRARFQNDTEELLAFIENPENRGEAVELGLLNPAEEVPDDEGSAAAPGDAPPEGGAVVGGASE